MEADDDDFYGGEGARGGEPMSTAVEGGFKEEQMDVSEGQEEDEDSDDVWIGASPWVVCYINNVYIGCAIYIRKARRHKNELGVGIIPSISRCVCHL